MIVADSRSRPSAARAVLKLVRETRSFFAFFGTLGEVALDSLRVFNYAKCLMDRVGNGTH